jgi:hypothetical protein
MANPPEGEQRCHGSCNVGAQPTDRAVDPWEIAGRSQTRCDVSHHLPPSRAPERPRDLPQLFEELASNVPALVATADGFVSVTLVMDQAQRAAFRLIATPYEITRSQILNASVFPNSDQALAATPIIDDVNTVIAYFELGRFDIHSLHIIRDVDGNELLRETETRAEAESDELGNQLLATIVTLGGAILVRALARAVVRLVATDLASAVLKAGINAARGISPEAADVVLLFLRSLRARSIVRSFVRRGLKVVVSIGGEAGPEEVAKFGEQIALNHQVRMGIGRRYIPHLIKEPGENIGRVFEEETVDRVVSRRLDAWFDTDRVAEGAFKVLKKGGDLNMELFTNNPEFGSRFVQSLIKAGFDPKKIQNMGNTVFIAVKG